jgi:hypothetical protein
LPAHLAAREGPASPGLAPSQVCPCSGAPKRRGRGRANSTGFSTYLHRCCENWPPRSSRPGCFETEIGTVGETTHSQSTQAAKVRVSIADPRDQVLERNGARVGRRGLEPRVPRLPPSLLTDLEPGVRSSTRAPLRDPAHEGPGSPPPEATPASPSSAARGATTLPTPPWVHSAMGTPQSAWRAPQRSTRVDNQ